MGQWVLVILSVGSFLMGARQTLPSVLMYSVSAPSVARCVGSTVVVWRESWFTVLSQSGKTFRPFGSLPSPLVFFWFRGGRAGFGLTARGWL